MGTMIQNPPPPHVALTFPFSYDQGWRQESNIEAILEKNPIWGGSQVGVALNHPVQ